LGSQKHGIGSETSCDVLNLGPEIIQYAVVIKESGRLVVLGRLEGHNELLVYKLLRNVQTIVSFFDARHY
jgi:hypothetical protein